MSNTHFVIYHKIKNSTNNKRYISIPISGMGQWLMIKNKIDNASFLQSNKVKLISKDFVVLAIIDSPLNPVFM